MKIIVTGSTGFIGRHLIPKLLLNNHQILELTRDLNKSALLFSDSTDKYLIDENHHAFIEKIIDFKPEVIIHLASFLTSSDEFEIQCKLLDANIVFFCKLLDATKYLKVKLFINTGTFAEYFSNDDTLVPAYLYAATKSAARFFLDYYSRVYNFKQATLIPYTVYGGEDSQKKIIDLIIESTYSMKPISLTPGGQILDFIHIDDVVSFYLFIIGHADYLNIKSEFHIGTGKGHSIKDVARIVEKLSGERTNINWGGQGYRKSDIMYAVAKENNNINWIANIDIEEGILKLIKNRK
jgi:nucleoside-diphosphate-sugar epimerase